jgi:hypothetical protein
MKVTFDPAADRGAQYTVEMDSGNVVGNVSMATVMGLAQGAGKSIRQAGMIVAQAKLAGAAHAAAAAAAATRAATLQ